MSRKPVPIENEQVEQATAMILAGETLRSIAEKTQINHQLLTKRIKLITGKSVRDLKASGQQNVLDSVEAVKKGQPINAACLEFGSNRYKVAKYLKEHGIPLPGHHHKHTPVSPEIIAEIVERLGKGEFFHTIAKEYGVSLNTLRHDFIKMTGKKIIGVRGQVPLNSKAEQAVALVREGKTLQFAADAVGVSRQMVSVWVQAAAVPPAQEQHRLQRLSRVPEAADLIQSKKLSASEIAQRLNIPRKLVVDVAEKANITLPRLRVGPELHPAHLSAVKDLRNGVRCLEIVAKYGVTINTARKWAVEAGVDTGWIPPRLQQAIIVHIADRASKGESALSLSKEFKLPVIAMMEEARKFGGDHLFRKKVKAAEAAK